MIKLRPIKMNANWDDMYGDSSDYALHEKYTIPSGIAPRSLVKALASGDWDLSRLIKTAYFRVVTSEGSLEEQKAIFKVWGGQTDFHAYGNSILITYTLKRREPKQTQADVDKIAELSFRNLPEYWNDGWLNPYLIDAISKLTGEETNNLQGASADELVDTYLRVKKEQ